MLIGIPSFVSEFLFQYRDLAIKNKKFKMAHSSYISGFRVKANVLNLMFYPIFMFRRLTFAASITILYNYPAIQLTFISAGTVSVFF